MTIELTFRKSNAYGALEDADALSLRRIGRHGRRRQIKFELGAVRMQIFVKREVRNPDRHSARWRAIPRFVSATSSAVISWARAANLECKGVKGIAAAKPAVYPVAQTAAQVT